MLEGVCFIVISSSCFVPSLSEMGYLSCHADTAPLGHLACHKMYLQRTQSIKSTISLWRTLNMFEAEVVDESHPYCITLSFLTPGVLAGPLSSVSADAMGETQQRGAT